MAHLSAQSYFKELHLRQVSLASLGEDLCCPICWKQYTADHRPMRITCPSQRCVNLVCSHIFGHACLEQHLSSSHNNSNKCPICRRTWFDTHPNAHSSPTTRMDMGTPGDRSRVREILTRIYMNPTRPLHDLLLSVCTGVDRFDVPIGTSTSATLLVHPAVDMALDFRHELYLADADTHENVRLLVEFLVLRCGQAVPQRIPPPSSILADQEPIQPSSETTAMREETGTQQQSVTTSTNTHGTSTPIDDTVQLPSTPRRTHGRAPRTPPAQILSQAGPHTCPARQSRMLWRAELQNSVPSSDTPFTEYHAHRWLRLHNGRQ